MPDYVKVREVIEYTLKLPQGEYEEERFHGTLGDAIQSEAISREEIVRWHETDYLLHTDLDRELYILLADGAEVFSHRSHDAVVQKHRDLTGCTIGTFLFKDIDDPDKSWRVLKPVNMPMRTA